MDEKDDARFEPASAIAPASLTHAATTEAGYDHYLTAGALRRMLHDVSDDEKVYYQRIEDVYFEKHGWTSTLVDGDSGDEPAQYVRAFTVWRKDGRVLITAHY